MTIPTAKKASVPRRPGRPPRAAEPVEESRETPVHRSREQETWDANAIHQTFEESWVEEGSMPRIEPRPGFDQRWIASVLGGNPNPQRLAQAATQGWRRRDPSTVPQTMQALTDYVEGVGGVIGVSGMILMERPQNLSAIHRKKKQERNDAQRRSVDEHLFRAHQPNSGFGPPARVEDKTRVSRGRRPAPVEDD